MKFVTRRVYCLLACGSFALAGIGACANSGDGDGAPAGDDDAGDSVDTSVSPGADGSAALDAAPSIDAASDSTGDEAFTSIPDAVADGPVDAAIDAFDAGPPVGFDTTCTSPSVFTDPFTTNPLLSRWTSIVGTVTYQPGFSNPSYLALANGGSTSQVWIGARPTWTNYTVSVPVRIDAQGSNGNGGVNFRMTSVGTSNNAGEMYYVGLSTSDLIIGIENGNWSQFADTPGTFTQGTFYTLTVSAVGNVLNASVTAMNGGTTAVTYTTPDAGTNALTTGSFGFRTFNMAMSYGGVTVTCD